MKINLPIALSLLLPIAAHAQTLQESLEVEGTYTPVVIVQDRVSQLPALTRFEVEQQPMPYSAQSVPAAYAPGFSSLPATSWGAVRYIPQRRGYLNLAGGSWLNTNLSAGYRFMPIDAPTQVGAYLQFNSTSLLKPYNDLDIKRKRYDGLLSVYGGHDFGFGKLSASLTARVAYFNYYSVPIANTEKVFDTTPTQTLTDISFAAGWSAPTSANQIRWDAGVDVRYFGYRALYVDGMQPLKGQRETDLGVYGSFRMPWDDNSAIDVSARLDALFYNDIDAGNTTYVPVDNYGNFTLRPGYEFHRDLLSVRLGVELDITAKAGPESDRFNAFHIAPDVRLDWRNGPVGLYAHALGGTRLQTLAALSQLDYYQRPCLAQTTPLYSPIDATVGASFGPFAGFSAGLHFGYAIQRNVGLRGWYMPAMLGAQEPGIANPLFGIGELDVKGFRAGLELQYAYGSLLKLTAKGEYANQNGDKGYFNGYDRPRWVADATLSVTPWKPLTFDVNFQYRGVRNIYTYYLQELPNQVPQRVLASYRLRDLTLLGIAAKYNITERFAVFGRLDNLLNRKVQLLPMQPQEGLGFMVGLDATF